MKKITTRKSAKAVKIGDINLNDGVLVAAEGDVLEQGETSEEKSFEEGTEDDLEDGIEGEQESQEEAQAEETDPDMIAQNAPNAATGHTIPLELGGNTVYITNKMLLAIMATDSAKAVKKELSTLTKEQREDNKKAAAAKRGQKFSTVKEIAEEMGISADRLKKAGVSQFINGDKKTMTIVGITFDSPIGKGGARYYVNHGKQMSEADKQKRLELAKYVAVAASLAAQEAGLKAMREWSEKLGIKLAFVEEAKA